MILGRHSQGDREVRKLPLRTLASGLLLLLCVARLARVVDCLSESCKLNIIRLLVTNGATLGNRSVFRSVL